MSISSRFCVLSSTLLPNLKVSLLCFVAVSPSLGTAFSAIGRVILVCLALALLVVSMIGKKQSLNSYYSPLAVSILASIFYMGLSISWSDVALHDSLNALTRHARILSIILVVLVISSQSEAKVMLRAFVAGQVFVVLSAWLLVLSADVPWATAASAKTSFAVFGSYLEQSISQAVLAAILWFQRDWIFGRHGRWVAVCLSLASVVLTLGYMNGRTGTLVCLGLIFFAVFKEVPRKFLGVACVAAFAMTLLGIGSSKTMFDRFLQVKSEVNAYSQKSATGTSSGQRLLYWQVSTELIEKRPFLGYGVGSWNKHYQIQQHGRADPSTLKVIDPHQLFLLWAVEGGLLGLSLLAVVFINIFYCSRQQKRSNAFCLQAVLLALIISSLFNSMIYGIGMGDFFCIAFGILLWASAKPPSHKTIGQHV